MEATHLISAVYFPAKKELELTWEDLTTGKKAGLLIGVDNEKGNEITEAVPPCLHHGATNEKN